VERGYAYITSIVTKVSIEFAEKEERKQKGGYEYKTEHKPHSARNTGRKTCTEESTRHRLIETGKQVCLMVITWGLSDCMVITGGLSVLYGHYRGLSDFMVITGGLSVFFHCTGGLSDFTLTFRGFISDIPDTPRNIPDKPRNIPVKPPVS